MNALPTDPLPHNEKSRLQALHRLGIMHSVRSPEFDAIVEVAATLFDCPVALVTLVDEDEQWFKARCGLDIDGTSRDVAFCRYTILESEPLIVPDALADERFRDSSLVTGSAGVRFYAGCPLTLDGEHMLGSLCVIDTRPRTPSQAQIDQLRRLATAVEGLIQSHARATEADRLREETTRQRALVETQSEMIAQTTSVSGVGGWDIDLGRGEFSWTDQARALHEVADGYVPDIDAAIGFYAPEAQPLLREAIRAACEEAQPFSLELPLLTARARERWVRTIGRPICQDGKVIRIIGAISDVTDRKTAELRLQHSELLYRSTLESLSEGVLVVDGDGAVVSCNPAALAMLGMDTQDLTGTSLSDLALCFVDKSGDQVSLGNLLADGASDPSRLSNTVAGLNLADGRGLRWFNLNAVPFASPADGGETGVVISLGDITEMVRQAMTLEGVFQNYPGAVVYFDEDHKVAGWNRNFEVLLDVAPGYLANRPSLEDYVRMNAERGEYGAGDVERLTRERLEAILSNNTHGYERSRPNGRVIDVRGTFLPGGGLLSTFLDITDRKQIEHRLIEKERLAREKSDELETVLANMNQGVSVFDRNGQLLLWNDNYVWLFERHLKDLRQGLRLEEIVCTEGSCGETPEDVDRHVADLRRRLAAGETVRSLFQLRSGRIVSTVHAPLPDGGWVGTHEDVTEREAAANQVLYAARHDTLTGLANRTYLNELLSDLVARPEAREQGESSGTCTGILMLIDLDRFKPVNDALGHNAGDQVLREVAQRLRQCVRDCDIVGRVGGDEFAVVLSSASGMSWPSGLAETIARRILEAMEPLFVIDGSGVRIGVSIGIAPVTHGASINELMRKADEALYAVKNEGRNNFHVYRTADRPADNQVPVAHSQRRPASIARVPAASVEMPEVMFQPVVCLGTSEVRGYHAVESRSPEPEETRGTDAYQDVAALEASTAALIGSVVESATAWPDDYLVALDLSVRQFGLESLPAIVSAAVEKRSFDPLRLQLQVSDGYFLVNAADALRQLRNLRGIGVRLVLDRFGSDSSSLRLLGRFRFDALRMDRAGLNDVLAGERGEMVLRALTSVAGTLGVNVSVDGVDTEEQLALLHAVGCVQGTGRLFGPPKPAEALRFVA
ncbi:PAS-domain containing protein [Stappia sp.]|uniref:bifunctional diguanylate cyclase/phosphodiesterase n=1 Tax=Stappia sp. TaxID=1870903 RepID=UPI003A992B9A